MYISCKQLISQQVREFTLTKMCMDQVDNWCHVEQMFHWTARTTQDTLGNTLRVAQCSHHREVQHNLAQHTIAYHCHID